MSMVRMLAYDPDAVKPGWIAFIVVMLLVIATFLLWRNMNKQMRKIKVPYQHELRDGAAGSGDPPDTSRTDPGEAGPPVRP